MILRPLLLHGSERHPDLPSVLDDPTIHFDGESGLWIDEEGRPAILSRSAAPGTTKTATREGMDQAEIAGFSTTRITKTREGTDQTEFISGSTHNTRTREGIDQTETSERCTPD
jgi:hypothetical protein